MKSIALSFDLFRDLSQRAEDEVILRDCLDLLVKRNIQWLLRRPDTPFLFSEAINAWLGTPIQPGAPVSGMYYQPEPEGEEEFASIPRVLRQGSGDCDDLASWRVAELRVRWNDPYARVIWVSAPMDNDGDGVIDYIQYHVMVLRGDGFIEDPSLYLGMGDTAESIQAEIAQEEAEEASVFDFPEAYPEGEQWRWAA